MKRLRSTTVVVAVLASVLPLSSPAHADLTWDRVTANFTWPRSAFADVEATGPNDVWVVGTQGEICYFQTVTSYPDTGGPQPVRHRICPIPAKPVTQRWNGTRWTSYDPWGFLGGMGSVTKIYAKGPGNVFIQGYGIEGTRAFAHWNGTTLTKLPTPPQACSWGVPSFINGDFWLESCFWNGASWTTVPQAWHRTIRPDGIWGISRRKEPGGQGESNTLGWVSKFQNNAWHELFGIDAHAVDPTAIDMFLDFSVVNDDDIWVQIEIRHSYGTPLTSHYAHWNGTALTYDPPEPVPAGCCISTINYDPVTPEPERPSSPFGYYVVAATRIPGTDQYWAVGGGIEDVPNAKTDPLLLKSR
ncbi:hypothetical protein GCM10027589_00970 [Actinocorallia lasiicapitis]